MSKASHYPTEKVILHKLDGTVIGNMKKTFALILVMLLTLSCAAFAVDYTNKGIVKQVQQALNDAGYNCGTPDGIAGKKTHAAIRQYRQDKGLDDGEAIDDALLAALGLDSADDSGAGSAETREEPDPTALPEPTPPPKPLTEYEYTPMHYEIFDETIRVRIACEDIPVESLYEAQESFYLVGETDEGALQSCQIRVLEAPLVPRFPVETADYFDLVFAIPEKLEFRVPDGRIKLEDHYWDVPPVGRFNLDACSFVTNDGAYVLSLYTQDAYREFGKMYNAEWNGRDVEMILGGEILGAASNDYSIVHLLNDSGASSLKLIVSDRMKVSDTIKQPERVKEMTAATQYINYTYPGVTKLTYYLGETTKSFPEFDKYFPNLTELNIVCCQKYGSDSHNYLSENKKLHLNTCPKLKTLNITSPEESPFTYDPYLRTWLIAQAKVRPSLEINGEKASTIDFVSDLPQEARNIIELPGEYEQIKKIYLNSVKNKKLKEREVTVEDLVAPLYIAVVKDEQETAIACTSTEAKPIEDMSGLPQDMLAKSLSEAATIVMIYPVYEKEGVYMKSDGTKFSDALKCHTNLAVLKYDNGSAKVIANQTVATDSPPMKLISGSVRGDFMSRRGIQLIAGLLK